MKILNLFMMNCKNAIRLYKIILKNYRKNEFLCFIPININTRSKNTIEKKRN